MITKCPHCSTKFKASDNLEGKKTKCPKCEQSFTVNEYKEGTKQSTGISSIGNKEPQICGNCDREIGHLERSYVLNGVVVCAECETKLARTDGSKRSASKGKKALIIGGITAASAIAICLLILFLYAPLNQSIKSTFPFEVSSITRVPESEDVLRSIRFTIRHSGEWKRFRGYQEYVLLWSIDSKDDMVTIAKQLIETIKDPNKTGRYIHKIDTQSWIGHYEKYHYFIGNDGCGCLRWEYTDYYRTVDFPPRLTEYFVKDAILDGIRFFKIPFEKLFELDINIRKDCHGSVFTAVGDVIAKAQVWCLYEDDWVAASDVYETVLEKHF